MRLFLIFSTIVLFQSLLLCMHNDFYRMLFQNREGMERGNPLRSTVYRKGLFHLMNETINPGIISKPFFPSSTLLHSRTFFLYFFFYIYWVSQQVLDENFQWKSQFKRSKNWARGNRKTQRRHKMMSKINFRNLKLKSHEKYLICRTYFV